MHEEPKKKRPDGRLGKRIGGEEEIRTPDPRVANAMLYQLSYFPMKLLQPFYQLPAMFASEFLQEVCWVVEAL